VGALPETSIDAVKNRLSATAGEERYAAERQQGHEYVVDDLEHYWGWSSPAGKIRADRRARFLIERAGLAPGTRCLELGCGTGEFTRRIVESGCDLTAVELSEELAARCRERVGERAEIVVGNVETGEGLEGRSYDAIVGVSILHHVNMGLCLRNTFSLLEPRGRFAFSEPNLANPQIWAMKKIGFVGRLLHETEHETAFLTSGLRRLFESAGLAVDVCEPFEFLHPSTPPRLIAAVERLERGLERTPLRGVAGSIRIAGHRP
jgi:2-polyprenyl-3-methyl-5-hydroxy-6-metoxy-1,4-benzoquinol methylase